MKIAASIFKTLFLCLCIIANTHLAYAQTASILPQGKTQFLDNNGKPLTSGTVDFYIPSTTTRKTTWQNSAETIANANPVVLDAGGRAIIYGDGSYRQVVKDRLGNIIWDQVTSSTGSGSGGSTATGDGDLVGTIKPWAGMTAPNQYVFTYGQEISRTTYSALFTAITSSQSVFCTSGSPTLTGLSDTTNFWVGASVEVSCLAAGFSTIISKTSSSITLASNANVSTNVTAIIFPWGRGNGTTTFNVPDLRGFAIAGNNNMGGVASSQLNTTYFGATDPNSVGAAGGSQSKVLLTANLPPYTPAGAITNGAITITQNALINNNSGSTPGGGFSIPNAGAATISASQAISTFAGAAQGGTSTAFSLIQPTKTSNYIIKITPDTNSATASGVTSLGGMTGDIACGSGVTCTGNNISATAPSTYLAPTPQDFGAACDGITDDTTALQLWLNNVRNGNGLPPSAGGRLTASVCTFTSALTTPVGNDYTIQGVGQSSILKYTGAATNIDLLTIGDGVNTNSRLNFRNFAITSSTTMTAGTAFRLRRAVNTTIDNVSIGDYGTTQRLWNGIWINIGSFNSIININKPIFVNADGIRWNFGAELNINNVAIVMAGVGTNAIHTTGSTGGLYLGQVSIFGTEVGLRVDTSDTAASNNQFFLSNGVAFDNNTVAGIYLNDSIAGNKSFSMQGWCSSATVTSSGCLTVNAFANGNIQIGGGAQFLSNNASAIYYSDNTVNLIIDAAAALSASVRYGVECTVSTSKVISYSVQVAANTLGNYSSNCNVPVLTANHLMYGQGAASQPAVLASLGTTTTVLHGNAAGLPTFGAVANADLVNSATTVNGQTCTLGSTCTVTASSITGGAALSKADDTNVTLTLTGSPTTALLAAATVTAGWSGQLSLARGGTAANLTASNGGIFYSTASAGAILSGTATARQMLQSGASAAPAWSTTTWPATTTINRLLYSSAANVISDLATANSSILVTDSGGIPSLSSTLPAFTLGGTVSGGGNQINNVIIGTTTPLAGTFNALTVINSQNGDTVAQVTNSNAGAAATARLLLTTNAGTASFVAASTAGGSAFNWTYDAAGPTQFLAQNAAGTFVFYTGASPATVMRIYSSGGLAMGVTGAAIADPGNGNIAATRYFSGTTGGLASKSCLFNTANVATGITLTITGGLVTGTTTC